MSLWWAKKEQLDEHQIKLIEDAPLVENHVVVGPPGSGKTNVLLRRAQFVRSQGRPNVMTLTFTRALTEFVRTGCYDSTGKEIFPVSCVSTIESWIRWIYREHKASLPVQGDDLSAWKTELAQNAIGFVKSGRIPRYDGLFVDECQDLLPAEVELLQRWGETLFFVGDDKQQIYDHSNGLSAIEQLLPGINRHVLPFHYRLAPEICEVADRIQVAGQDKLSATENYNGPRPGRVERHGPLSRSDQLLEVSARLKDQLRAYADFLDQGDRVGIIVPRQRDRDAVLAHIDGDRLLAGKAQIIRARDPVGDHGYDPSFDPSKPISILTAQACKGLEFRAVHWLFADDLQHRYSAKLYYTVVTRAKTTLDIYYDGQFPPVLARACPPPNNDLW